MLECIIIIASFEIDNAYVGQDNTFQLSVAPPLENGEVAGVSFQRLLILTELQINACNVN